MHAFIRWHIDCQHIRPIKLSKDNSMQQALKDRVFGAGEVASTTHLGIDGTEGGASDETRGSGAAKGDSTSRAIEKVIPIDRENPEDQARHGSLNLGAVENTIRLSTEEIAAYVDRATNQAAADPEDRTKTVRVDMREIQSRYSEARKAAENMKIEEVENGWWPIIRLVVGIVVAAAVCIYFFT